MAIKEIDGKEDQEGSGDPTDQDVLPALVDEHNHGHAEREPRDPDDGLECRACQRRTRMLHQLHSGLQKQCDAASQRENGG